MAVGCVDDDGVDTSLDEGGGALERVGSDAYAGGYAQTSE